MWSAQAARGDTLETRASLLQRQLRIGDACTWRLIEKNVVALLPPSQAYLKNQAAGALSDLIKCGAHLRYLPVVMTTAARAGLCPALAGMPMISSARSLPKHAQPGTPAALFFPLHEKGVQFSCAILVTTSEGHCSLQRRHDRIAVLMLGFGRGWAGRMRTWTMF